MDANYSKDTFDIPDDALTHHRSTSDDKFV
jgi:hypothetical protein